MCRYLHDTTEDFKRSVLVENLRPDIEIAGEGRRHVLVEILFQYFTVNKTLRFCTVRLQQIYAIICILCLLDLISYSRTQDNEMHACRQR